MAVGERERIARYFAPLTAAEPGSFNLRDDAALLLAPAGQALVITTDSVIEGLHVMVGASPAQFASKLVRRNLSDLAAMGAVPWRYTLNLHTPAGLSEAWFEAFAATLLHEQTLAGMVLVGGDSTAAAGARIHVTLGCYGLLSGPPLLRSGAQAGDDLYVSGTIGDAALGLKMLQQQLPEVAELIARYHLPTPRLALGQALSGLATAALDISDGLLADVHQLCVASQLGAVIDQFLIPLSVDTKHLLLEDPSCWDAVFAGGDDYELCFTAPPAARGAVAELAAQLALPLTRIGSMTAAGSDSLLVRDASGHISPAEALGFTHG